MYLLKNLVTFIIIQMILLGNLCIAQVTFNRNYDFGSDLILNILPLGNEYWFMMNTHQMPTSIQLNKIDSLGNIVYSNPLIDTMYSASAYNLLLTSDSNLISGSTKRDIATNTINAFLIKFNLNGDTLWSKIYSAPLNLGLYSFYLIETSDKGFLITGQLWDPFNTTGDIFILKTDSTGNFQWLQDFGGINNEAAYSSIQTVDNGYLTIAFTRSFGFGNAANRDDLLVKWDSLGNYQWHKTFGTADDQYAVRIQPLLDGNFIFGSSTYSSVTGIQNGRIVKINDNGDIIWQKLYAPMASIWSLMELNNTNIISVGSSRQLNTNKDDGLIICADSSGTEIWRRRYRIGSDHCYIREVKETTDGGFIVTGFVFDGPSGNQDGWILKLDSTGCLSSGCGEPTSLLETPTASSYTISVSPNPVKEQAVIKIEGLSAELLEESFIVNVYDLTGKLVSSPRTGFLIADDNVQFIFKSESLVSGIYLLEISTIKSERLGVVKLVVQ